MATNHDSIRFSNNANFSVKHLDICIIKSLNDKAHLILEGNRVKWTQDLNALKFFVENIVGLNDSWKSAGGKAKLFNSTYADLRTTWYPGKQSSLLFHGKDDTLLREYLLETLKAPIIDNSSLNINRSGQGINSTCETLKDLCEVVLVNDDKSELFQPIQDT